MPELAAGRELSPGTGRLKRNPGRQGELSTRPGELLQTNTFSCAQRKPQPPVSLRRGQVREGSQGVPVPERQAAADFLCLPEAPTCQAPRAGLTSTLRSFVSSMDARLEVGSFLRAYGCAIMSAPVVQKNSLSPLTCLRALMKGQLTEHV